MGLLQRRRILYEVAAGMCGIEDEDENLPPGDRAESAERSAIGWPARATRVGVAGESTGRGFACPHAR
jgi:hypothetical protein